MNVMMRDLNSDSGNEGTDNIDIYSKILQSRDFIEGIGQMTVHKYKQSYFDDLTTHRRRPFWEHLFVRPSNEQEQKDVIYDIIRDHLKYYLSSKSQTLEIQITDQDAEVAADVLDQTLAFLKAEIERLRSHRAGINKENAAYITHLIVTLGKGAS
jgi:light-regulated signal transduction histidine kinase (bacteriophytochrome)